MKLANSLLSLWSSCQRKYEGSLRRLEELIDHNASLTLSEGEGRRIECKHPWLLGSLRDVWQGLSGCPQARVRCQKCLLGVLASYTLVSLISINWLFIPLDINKWYRNTHIWCLLKYISYSRPQKVSDLSAIFFYDLTRQSVSSLFPH